MSTNSIRIFVADNVSDSGLQPFRDADFVVEKRTGLDPAALREALVNFDGLVVRSETEVKADLMDAVPTLRVIGRAGAGVDNIDVPAATARGIVVMNAPDGNTITTAEHTMALLLALARQVPQAHGSLQSGKWDRKKYIGVELQGKTLGVLGLGRIGLTVASRAHAFGMKIVAFDPFYTPDHASEPVIEVASFDEVLASADFLTVHTPLTGETRGMVGKDAFAKMKKGVRIINCARGGLIDEDALYEAIKSGTVVGAALDVFVLEPPPADHPLLGLDEVVTTPHLGASTTEAQEGVAFTVAEQMRDYLLTGALRGAVNVAALGAKELSALQPYITLAESLGRFQAQLLDGEVQEVRMEFAGEIADMSVTPVTRSFLAGLLHDPSVRVNLVNAFLIAEGRNIRVASPTFVPMSHEAVPAIHTQVLTSGGAQTLSGSLFDYSGQTREGRVTEIDGFRLEAFPQGHMLVMWNQDTPGVVGRVGTILGDLGVNISRFHLGRRKRGGEAMAVIEVDAPLDEATLMALRDLEPVISARQIKL